MVPQLETIADLNKSITSSQALGESTSELEDLRDQAFANVSQLIDVRSFKRTSGEIVVTLPDGRVLADKVAHGPKVAANWELDGGRYIERWWFG